MTYEYYFSVYCLIEQVETERNTVSRRASLSWEEDTDMKALESVALSLSGLVDLLWNCTTCTFILDRVNKTLVRGKSNKKQFKRDVENNKEKETELLQACLSYWKSLKFGNTLNWRCENRALRYTKNHVDFFLEVIWEAVHIALWVSGLLGI